MDLEMTGLDARRDQIIEVATVLTDQDLRVVAEGPEVVIHAELSLFDEHNQVAREMHEQSGLLPLVMASTLSLADAEQQVLAFLKAHVAPQSAPLCGNTIHMDRHFLRLQMPRVDQYLFYRIIDVSSVKELARRWAPEIYAEAKRRKGQKPHRAGEDVHKSIEELAFYRDTFFTLPR
jgi:oligoribonuclease